MSNKICLFPHAGYLSETSRMVAVYKALEERGITAVMATHGGTYEWVLEQENIPYAVVEPRMDVERCRAFVRANTMEGKTGRFYEADELESLVTGEAEFFTNEEIGVVLTGFNLSLGLSARMAGCLYCVTHLGSWNPLIFEREMQTPFNYLTHRMPAFISRRFLKKLVNRIYLNSTMMTGVFNKVASRLSLEHIHSTMDMFMGDLTLVTEAPELLGIGPEELESWKPTKPGKFHENIRLKYAGPMYAKLFGELDQGVQQFLGADGPKIYIALTSSKSEFVTSVVTALSRLDVSILVAGTVHDLDISVPNVLARDHLPSHRVMPMVDLAIIHGGQGSVQTAVASGTPVIGFPLQTEQMFNLQLIQDQGGGINLPLQALEEPALIVDAVNTILRDSSYSSRMAELAEIYRRYDGPAEVARIISDEAALHGDGKRDDAQ